MLGDHRRYAPRRRLDAAHRAAADDARAPARGAAGDCAPGPRGLGPAVARGVERAGEPAARAENLRELAAGDDFRVESVRARDAEPLRKPGELFLALGEVERAALAEAEVFAEVCGELLPDREALDHERQLDRRSALLAHPAPVAPGLLAGDAALLEQRDRDAGPGEEVRGRAADDAAADDHDVGRLRQRIFRGVEGELVRVARVDLRLAAHRRRSPR